MKILIWNGHHDCLDAAIKFLTHGKGSHAAFLRADGVTVHEAFYPKLRERALTETDMRNAVAFDVEGVRAEQHAAFETLFDFNLTRNIRYSILDLVRYAFNLPVRDEHHTFCSRYVMYCCRGVLPQWELPLVRLPFKDWASPRDLQISPRLKRVPWRERAGVSGGVSQSNVTEADRRGVPRMYTEE